MSDFLVFALVGFVAQLADGALGMGFGVISSAVLLSQGVPPPLVSASVNAAKIPTGMAAGLSHLRHGNVQPRVLLRLALGGCIGGVIGALILSGLKGRTLMALIVAYLFFIGAVILIRGLTGRAPRLISTSRAGAIGAIGGLIEGIGGSWGPVVTTGLLGSGTAPRFAIGTSAVAELTVSVTVFLALLLTFHSGMWGQHTDWSGVLSSVGGLIAGGVPAAFLGGYLASRVPVRPLTIAVGLLAIGIAVQRLLMLI